MLTIKKVRFAFLGLLLIPCIGFGKSEGNPPKELPENQLYIFVAPYLGGVMSKDGVVRGEKNTGDFRYIWDQLKKAAKQKGSKIKMPKGLPDPGNPVDYAKNRCAVAAYNSRYKAIKDNYMNFYPIITQSGGGFFKEFTKDKYTYKGKPLPYFNTKGQKVVDSFTNLFNFGALYNPSKMMYPIAYGPDGNKVPDITNLVWTGMQRDGSSAPGTYSYLNDFCGEWTVSHGAENDRGLVGKVGALDSKWISYKSGVACDKLAYIYCAQAIPSVAPTKE